MERRRWYINLKKNMQEKDGNKKKKERKHRLKKKNVKSKRTVSITKIKRSLYQLWAFNIREGEPFHSTRVNLILKHPRSTNYIVWAYLRANPVSVWVVTNCVLTFPICPGFKSSLSYCNYLIIQKIKILYFIYFLRIFIFVVREQSYRDDLTMPSDFFYYFSINT